VVRRGGFLLASKGKYSRSKPANPLVPEADGPFSRAGLRDLQAKG
jgi:hypothetical protein